MTTADLIFHAPTRALSINRTKGMHWAARGRALDPWQDMAYAAARNAIVGRRLRPGTAITVQVVIPFRNDKRRDPHNYTGTVVKAVVDGLVRAKVVPDDNPTWVTVLEPVMDVQKDKSEPLTATVRIRPRETP